jgi:hypothetical protein
MLPFPHALPHFGWDHDIRAEVIPDVMLFSPKKKYKSIKEYPDTWAIGQGIENGKPIFVKFRAGLQDATGHPEFPFQIGVAVPLLNPTSDGLTTQTEAEVLWRLEDRLNEILTHNDRSVFAFIITTGGMREYVFYAREWTPEQFDKDVHAIDSEGHQLQFMMRHDPHWDTYKEFTPQKISKT